MSMSTYASTRVCEWHVRRTHPQISKKISLGKNFCSQKNIDKNVAFRANLFASVVFSASVVLAK